MDIFTWPCPSSLSPLQKFAETLGEKLDLPTLSLHVHQAVGAVLFYQFVYLVISPALSRSLLPSFYPKFPRRTQINWDVHVVSFVQSVFICALALWGICTDAVRRQSGTEDLSKDGALYRVFGYTATGGAIQAYAAGYFFWDLVISVYHIQIMGFGFVAHAISALVVFCLGFRPFVNYYAPIFILFELSSPFLNIHWFCDKLKLTGSNIQLVNGFFLLGSFFCCRLVWGTWNSVLVLRDIFGIYAQPPPDSYSVPQSKEGNTVQLRHPYAGKSVPLWLAVVYLGSNICLNCLNYYWFSKMIRTVAARFKTTTQVSSVGMEKAGIDLVAEGSALDVDVSVGRELRKRRDRKSVV